MKKALLTKLRNIHTSRDDFRHTTEQLSYLLAGEAGEYLKEVDQKVETPLTITNGSAFAYEIVVVPILRAGLAMLPAFLRFYPNASVGFFGMRRDEITKKPFLYYENLPPLHAQKNVILIDPMVATGGSGLLALNKLVAKGVLEENIIYVGILGAPEGISAIHQAFPKCQLIVAQVDEKLNSDAFIVPGIGDFGDRYFGTDLNL